MTPLLTRIVAEKRPIVVTLAVVMLANAAAYALIVRPLGLRSAGAAERAVAAASSLRAAEEDYALARALVTGKTQADEELSAFYEKVLPANLSAANRMTYASLPALARKSNVRYFARTSEVGEADDDTRLRHLQIHMVLQGNYESLRDFIYQLETAPEFVVIDDVVLTETSADEPLTLNINLSTYFRARPDGV